MEAAIFDGLSQDQVHQLNANIANREGCDEEGIPDWLYMSYLADLLESESPIQ